MEKERRYFCGRCGKELDYYNQEIKTLPGHPYFQEGFGTINPQEYLCEEHYLEEIGIPSEEEKEISKGISQKKLEEKGLTISKSEKELSEQEISLKIGDQEFLFDRKGFSLFSEEFNDSKEYKLLISNGYLFRIYLGSEPRKSIDYFHRWLAERVGLLEDFSRKNDLNERFIHVHHKNYKKEDNRLSNLECKEGKKHLKDHEEIRVYENFKEYFREENLLKIKSEEFKNKFKSWWEQLDAVL